MVGMINEARAKEGLPALAVNGELARVARAKSRDMVENGYFGHHSPTYGSFSSMLDRYGIRYRAAGENIAMNSSGSVAAAHRNLMNSPGHRANIMERAYDTVGVGVYVASNGNHYYTQLFTGR